ncbi:MAG: CRISPR-associated endonuclease Cas2 [Brevinematales bacterium]
MRRELPSRFKAMWMMVIFDLPVQTKKQRKAYTHFRKFLVDQGFSMLQFSVYAQYCTSRDSMETLTKRLRENLPPEGQVRIFGLTERQYQEMHVFYGRSQVDSEEPPEMFLFL